MNYISGRLFRSKRERETGQRTAGTNTPHIPAHPLLTSASPQDSLQNRAVFDLDSVSLIAFLWSPLTFVFSFYYCFDSYPGYLTEVTQRLSCLLHEIVDPLGMNCTLSLSSTKHVVELR